MLWTVQHCWPEDASFVFNCYKHLVQLLLHQSGEPPVLLLSQEGIVEGDPILMVLYGITLIPLEEDLRSKDPGFLSPLYADNAAFDGSARGSAQFLKLLMDGRPNLGYLPKPYR